MNLFPVQQKLRKLKYLWQSAGSWGILRQMYLRWQTPQWVTWQRNSWPGVAPFKRQWNDLVYRHWLESAALSPSEWWGLHQEEHCWQIKPLIEIVIFAEDAEAAEATIVSLQRQLYPHWRAHLLLSEEIPPTWSWAEDSRIQLQFKVEAFWHTLHKILTESSAEWGSLLRGGDQLVPEALHEIVQVLQTHQPDLIYSDHDTLNAQQQRTQPQFKPAWSPWYALETNYLGWPCLWKLERLSLICGTLLPSAKLEEVCLRFTEGLPRSQIVHLPQVLLHHGKTASPDHWETSLPERKTLVQSALERRGIKAEVKPRSEAPVLQIRPILREQPLISLIIPFRDQWPVLQKALTSIFQKTSYPHFEIWLVDNQSQCVTREALLPWMTKHPTLHLLEYPHPFNYAAINNLAVNQARGEFVVLLNNDIEVLEQDWLEGLLGFAQFAEYGAIGPKLYYPNGTVQHAGVATGIFGAAGHPERYAPRSAIGEGWRLLATHEVSAVTAACLMVRKSYYQAVKGMDEGLRVAFNDVDFCLKLQAKGWQNLCVPSVSLIHHESLTRGQDDTPEKRERIRQEMITLQTRWGEALFRDPFYSPHWTLEAEDCFLRFPPLPHEQQRAR